MVMKPPILSSATLLALFAGLLPAADSQLVSLVMPDAKMLAGINVDQAKTTPFGQYVLTQVQAQGPHLQEIAALTGFDPTRDVHELLVSSNAAPGVKGGLLLARGNFDATRIQTAAQAAGGLLETYKGFTLLEDPKRMNGVAFLDPTLAVAGDIASVKGAIDRQTLPAPLPTSVMLQVNQWSGSQDAWFIADVPPATLHPQTPVPPNPAVQNALQTVQQAAGGIKFGGQVVLTSQAQTDTAQNATSLQGVVQFLASLAQMQAQQKNPQLAPILSSLVVTTSGNLVNLSLTVPESVAEQVVKVKPHAAVHAVPQARSRRL